MIQPFCGCRHGEAEKTPPGSPSDFPYEKTFTAERKTAARQLAQNYINALNEALKSGEFAPMKKVLPPKLISPKAEEIFKAMRTALSKYGTLESCEYYGELDCTFFVDHLWKFCFSKATGDSRLPRQRFEVLYRIRTIHPEKKPLIVKADFMLR